MNEFQLQKLLRRHAGLSEAALADLNHEAVKTGSPLEDVVLRSGLLTRERLHEYLAQELGVPYVDLTNYLIEPEMLALVPAELARKHEAMPLFRVSGILTVAMANPDDIGALDELRRALKLNINPVLADSASLREAISQHYRPENASAISEAVVEIEADDALRYIESGDKAKSIEQLAGEAPVVRFVSTIMQQAAGDRASDIHIEPEENGLRVRIRVDGLLHEVGRFPAMLQPAVTSRIKILAGMDISDRRRAQDGRFDFAYEGRQIDVRTSTFPTAYGENVVMRLLDKTGGFLKLEDLGMGSTILDRFRTLIRQPHGIILVTGPTGSGKTTTLYSALNVINSDEKNIMTLEDPIEYHLPGARHCQVNPKAGITFASGLRSILRQDPDIVLVGEIRDAETAEIAFQAALTGHLVLSTLHTNDAAGALTRLIDMNVEPFLIASSVTGILAQRLVRRVCDRCTEPYVPPAEVLERFHLPPGESYKRGRGCSACRMRGYRGRTGIYELLAMSPETRKMVMRRRSSEEIKATALAEGMGTLRDDALAKARLGLTTPEEVLRVTPDA